jgi:hypothetical protein
VHVVARIVSTKASSTSGSVLPERRIENLIDPYPCVLRPQHCVVVRAFDLYLFADVERPGHHIASLVRYERVASREEALRGTHKRDGADHGAHLLGGGAGGGYTEGESSSAAVREAFGL